VAIRNVAPAAITAEDRQLAGTALCNWIVPHKKT
jgi:hypothetical protein